MAASVMTGALRFTKYGAQARRRRLRSARGGL